MLLMIGKFQASFVYLLVGGVVFLAQALYAVKFRSDAFKKQNMGESTKIHWRKIFVIFKTIWYYFKMMIFPKRLGLFHNFLYHWPDHARHPNREFYLGVLSFIGCGVWFYFAPFTVRFGIMWYFLYLTIFSNLITAQQVVSERYVYYPSFGFAIILGYYLQDYPIILAFILGIYIMRIWVFLPTFQNEVRFYESNTVNFPDSEVAMGNLGVSYLNHRMPHKAMDTWFEATRQNPHYDVPWYNLYSMFKENGDILSARDFLVKCLNAKTIHFREQWTKELAEIDAVIAQAVSDGRIKVKNSANG